MSASLKQVIMECNDILQPQRFNDYCPNGLQVQGCETVARLVTGVTASMELLEQALATQADLVLVHHGYFWRGEDPCIKGMKKQRLAMLIKHDISLLAYHLPLDVHPQLGNNAQLAQRLGLLVDDPGGEDGLLWQGRVAAPLDTVSFGQHLAQVLGREAQCIKGGDHPVARIAWCSGAAQGHIERAVECGADTFLSGEISEPTVHVARECGIHYFAAGHYASERYGVQALGEELARRLQIEHRFIECDNPV